MKEISSPATMRMAYETFSLTRTWAERRRIRWNASALALSTLSTIAKAAMKTATNARRDSVLPTDRESAASTTKATISEITVDESIVCPVWSSRSPY